MTSLEELRARIAAFRRWRSAGRWRRSVISDVGVMELERWKRELREGEPDRLAWYVASQLDRAAAEYIRGDYNASRCRVRRLNNALDRWEQRGLCPWAYPSHYDQRDRALRLSPFLKLIQPLGAQ